MLKTIIIDDEAHIRDTLRKLLRMCCPQAEVIGEAAGVKDGMKKILTLHPDLVILDINLKDGTGYDLLHLIHPVNFRVIFISAFDRRSIQAFKLSSLAYLVKPFSTLDLARAIEEVEHTEVKYFDLILEALEANIRD